MNGEPKIKYMTFKTTLMIKHKKKKKITSNFLDSEHPTYSDSIMNNEGFDVVDVC